MSACRSVCGPAFLLIPARRVPRRTMRAAPCRSSRPPSAVTKSGPPARSPMARSIARAVRGASGMITTLAPLRATVKRPVAAFEARVPDVRAGRLGHAQPVQGQQGDQRVLGGRAGPRGDQERAGLVAVQSGGVGLVVQAGTAHAGRVREVLPRRRTCRTRRWWTAAWSRWRGRGPWLRVRGRRSRCRSGVPRTAGESGTGTSW
jgi:hypothetical protein